MREIALAAAGETVRLAVERQGDVWIIRRGTQTYQIALAALDPGVYLLTYAGRSYLVRAAGAGVHRALHLDGRTFVYQLAGPEAARRGSGPRSRAENLTVPMPGVVTQIAVHEGEAVAPGQVLVIVEAMKMEHVIRAPRAGVVRTLHVRPGEQVEGGTVVAEIGPDPAPAGGAPAP